MKKFPKHWYRKSLGVWYVEINGKQHNLGADREAAFERYHDLMRQPRQKKMSADAVLVLVEAFLEWCVKHCPPRTYEWYQYRLQLFARAIPRSLSVAQLKPYHVRLSSKSCGMVSGVK